MRFHYLALSSSSLDFTKQKKNIEKAVEERIQKIQIDGPDNSTLSGMVLAIDDEAEDDDSKHLTYQQIVDNVLFLIAAGSDTTSMTLTNTLFLLGFHTEVWDQVVAEQEKIIAEHGNNLSQDILERNCQYLDAVIKESMRLITISAGLFRTINETLVIDGYQIPKDWLAILSIYLTHEYDEKTWKEDLSHMDLFQGFKPERWLEVETRPKEFVPYGVGRRYCLGKALASTNMIVFLSVLVRNVKSLELLTDTKNLKWKDGLIDTPKDGVRMKLHPKN